MTIDPAAEDMIFAAQLKAAMGDELFDSLLIGLDALPRERVVGIAGLVLGGLPPSTTKRAAFAALRRRHDGKLATRLGLRAQGGRSAG
jgi:hypothetical protein